MSDKIDQFCDDLKVRLNDIEAQLLRVKDKLGSASKDAEETIKTKLVEARSQVESKKEEMVAVKNTMAKRLESKKEEIEAEVAAWKEKREQEKLLKHAEQAEEYAVAAILIAAAAAEEAEVAVLEAIDARKMAESITIIPVQEAG